ncbi:MAG: hypothetical protein ACREDZ_03635 [Kiloniellales bacterium]
MYRDNSLIPSEALRLLALGLLAQSPRRYGALVAEVRDFVGHVVGPSLDLLGAPLEVLKVEGLVAPLASAAAESATENEDAQDPPLAVTETGLAEARRLLLANVRPPANEINKLIVAVKIRFLHLLPIEEQRMQADMLAESCQREALRLTELRGRLGNDDATFLAWLDREIAAAKDRLAWFRALDEKLG